MTPKATKSNNPAGRPQSEKVTASLHKAVWKLIEETNYKELTIERIAETAGVSRPALYRRYSNVGELTLDALLAFDSATLLLPVSKNIDKDLCLYFEAITASLEPQNVVGKALRGVLAHALVHAAFAPKFAEFIAKRREPVRLRLLAWQPNLSEEMVELALDGLFGPILYRSLIRQIPTHSENIAFLVSQTLQRVLNNRIGPAHA